MKDCKKEGYPSKTQSRDLKAKLYYVEEHERNKKLRDETKEFLKIGKKIIYEKNTMLEEKDNLDKNQDLLKGKKNLHLQKNQHEVVQDIYQQPLKLS